MSTTVEIQVHLGRAEKGRVVLREGRPPPPAPIGRVPRVARLMALAIRIDRLVREGVVRDYAEVARLGHVTRARVAQVTALLNLAPDLQDQVLHFPLTERGRDPISERDLRPIAACLDWGRQRRLWLALPRRVGYTIAREMVDQPVPMGEPIADRGLSRSYIATIPNRP